MAVSMVALVAEQNTTFILQHLAQRHEILACRTRFHVGFEDLSEFIVPAGPSSFSPRLRITQGSAVLISETMLF